MKEELSYNYRAARQDGAIELGKLDAPSRDAASTFLIGRGLFPIDIRLARSIAAARGKLPLADLAIGLRVLGVLLEAGLPLSRALNALETLVPSSWEPVLLSVSRSITEGHSLAAAFVASPAAFPPVVIGIVRAGEGGSGLASAVQRAADLTESALRTRSAVRAALAYPLVLAAAGAASIALLVEVVLPRFAAILADLGQELPTSTRIVLEISVIARAAALPAFGISVFGFFMWSSWVHTPSGGRGWSRLMLSVPIVGPIRFSAATAKSCAALAALLQSGVPFSSALLHGADASGDIAIRDRMLVARQSVLGGQSVASAFEVTLAMTPTAIRMTRAGEQTGKLGEMLHRASLLEEDAASRAVQSFVRLLEPAMILIFGAIVALLAASLLQAIYSVRPT